MEEISREIITRASQGDLGCFEQIYKRFCGFVFNVALRIVNNSADAQEVTQDVFMNVYHNMGNFQFRSSFKTWVYRIAVNVSINSYRRNSRFQRSRVSFDDVAETLPVLGSSADGAINNDAKLQLGALLDKLAPEFKVCLILREIDGLSYQEIASVLSIPVNTVRSRLSRARQSLLDMAGKVKVLDAV